MAAGDKKIISIANRDSLQYKQARTYGAGSVCIKDSLFYEANDEIAGGTTFAEGTTGATWKLVGSKPVDDWGASKAYKVGDQVFAEAALWKCKTAHTSAATFADTNWDLKAGLINETDFTLATETLNTVNFKAIKPNTAHEYLLGTPSFPFKAAYLEGIDFYDGTDYIGNIDADSNHLGIYSGTSTNTTTKLQLGTKNNAADISIEDTSISINKTLNLNNKNLLGANVITFNDIGTSEGIVWDDWIVSQGYANQLTFFFDKRCC